MAFIVPYFFFFFNRKEFIQFNIFDICWFLGFSRVIFTVKYTVGIRYTRTSNEHQSLFTINTNNRLREFLNKHLLNDCKCLPNCILLVTSMKLT